MSIIIVGPQNLAVRLEAIPKWLNFGKTNTTSKNQNQKSNSKKAWL